MRVVITGGGGFLGNMLCQAIRQRGFLTAASNREEPVEELVLLDKFIPASPEYAGVTAVVGDLSDAAVIQSVIRGGDSVSIFHLASMVSGECEADFDAALRVNLDGGRNVFQAARQHAMPCRVVFASSIACFGGDTIPKSFDDQAKLLPQTTYGMTKVMCELLINEHTRKGHFDGRSARLPTVIVRPGKPNAAASSWASGMFREPLAGEDCLLPIRRDHRHPMTDYRTVVESLIKLHECDGQLLGKDRAVGLPAHSIAPHDAAAIVKSVATEMRIRHGDLQDAFDPAIQKIVDGWATAVDGTRALRLGLPAPPPLRLIVERYMQDFGHASMKPL